MVSSKNKKASAPFIITVILFSLCIICIAVFSVLSLQNPVTPAIADQVTTTAEPAVPVKVSEATIGSSGDVLIHVPIFNAAYSSSTKTYDFSNIFTYSSAQIKDCDYFVANLETTLGGTENGRKYTGYPMFNSPDSITDALKDAGVDCLLTANNHCYDTSSSGVIRTQQIVKAAGFDYTGTRMNETDKQYLVKEVNGINFGMVCYTYETETKQENRKALNGILVSEETADLINSFDYTKIDEFYSEMRSQIQKMKNDGAEVLVAYLHWGNEYQLQADSHQKEIAQKLCDMGIDVIVGGHPHVVQPVDLITSTDGTHKMVCVYSMGNMVSNQRRNLMGLKTGHTEDGMIFKMTFSKYSDGTVVFEKIKVIPTWVHLYTSNGKSVYSIVPLGKSMDSKAEKYGLTKSSNGLSLANESYKRTMALVSDGVKKSNNYLKSVPKPGEEPVTASSETASDAN
ncbi:MAG: CapA family protein [Faecalibacterium sp.]|nr:CapA family protein [Ruminococcus sp.]MCM1391830.1 CapA family protein [Ruminococcus sp.]MCM1485476.1 CapA family protein [Faecalibacterium sp.]